MTDNKKNTADFDAEDFEAIERAVIETERGRWFLAEYAARNRRSETTSLLTSISRLEKAIASELQNEINTTYSIDAGRKLAVELETLVGAISFPGAADTRPVERLAQKIASNSFTLAQLADTIRDRIDELELVGLPPEAVIKLGQATQQIISLTAHQSQLCRHIEALAKIIDYLQSRLSEATVVKETRGSDNISATLSLSSFNKLRQKVEALHAKE